MTHGHRIVVAITATLLALPLAGADAWIHAEANGDASASPDAPTPLPGPGQYYATLASGDADWFSLSSVAAPSCIAATARATKDFALTLGAQGGHRVTTPVPGGEWTRLVVAVAPGAKPLVGQTQPASSLLDAFILSRTLPAEAAQEIGDAGATPASSQALPGECTRGSLSSVVDLDAADVFAVSTEAGSTLVYSVAGQTGLSVAVLDAQGTMVAPPAMPGDIALFTPPTTGTYYLSASSSAGTASEYVLAVLGPDPPGHPCRPYCMVS